MANSRKSPRQKTTPINTYKENHFEVLNVNRETHPEYPQIVVLPTNTGITKQSYRKIMHSVKGLV